MAWGYDDGSIQLHHEGQAYLLKDGIAKDKAWNVKECRSITASLSVKYTIHDPIKRLMFEGCILFFDCLEPARAILPPD